MEEAIDQGEAVVCPPVDERRMVVTRAHEALLRESEAGGAATFPLLRGRRAGRGADARASARLSLRRATLVVCEARRGHRRTDYRAQARQRGGPAGHAGRSAKGLWDKIAGSSHFGFKLAALGTVGTRGVFALMTGDFRVAADATLQGVVQRAVTAPIQRLRQVKRAAAPATW